jgi:hypothetical protein
MTDLRLPLGLMHPTSKSPHVKMRSRRQPRKPHSHSRLPTSNSSVISLPSQQASITKRSAFSRAYSHSRQGFQCQTKVCSLKRPGSYPRHRRPDIVGLFRQCRPCRPCRPCRAALGVTCPRSKQEVVLFKRNRLGYQGSGASLTLLQLVCQTLKLFGSV